MKINCALFLVFAVATNAQLRPPRPPPGNGDPLSRAPIAPIAPSPVPVPMTIEAELVDVNEIKSGGPTQVSPTQIVGSQLPSFSPTQIVVSQLPSFPSPQPGVTVPRPDGCSPGCGANEICAKLGDSYCRMGQACSVCIRMDSIRIPTPALAAIFSNQKQGTPSPTPSVGPTMNPFDLNYGSVIATAQQVASEPNHEVQNLLLPRNSGYQPQEQTPEPIGLTGGNNRPANTQSNLLTKLDRIRQKSTASQLPSDIQMERYLQRLATADSSSGTVKAVDTSTASRSNLGQPNLGQPNLGQPNLGQQNLGQPNLGQPNPGQPNIVDYSTWLQSQLMMQSSNNTNGTTELTQGNINDLWLQFNNFVKQRSQPGTAGASTSGVNPLVMASNTQTYVPTQQQHVNSDPFFGDMFGTGSTNSFLPMWPMFDMPLFGFGFF